MSSTYLYSDNDTTYDMSVSSTGTVLSYTDITTRVPLPSIQANPNKYLKVRNDGQNLEWAEVEIGGGLELILDERTTSNPPSVCFEDAVGTKYNTGINMYRDNVNGNNQTISLYANNVKQVDVASNRTIFHNTTRHIDGAQATPGVCFKDNPSCGLYRPALDTIGLVANNKRLMDVGINQVEIGKTGAGNDVNLLVNGIASAGTYRAGNGTVGTPSFSFTNDNDTGMYFETSGSDRLRFAINGFDRIISSSTGATQILGRITTDVGSVSSPSFAIDTSTGIYRPAVNEFAITNNGVQNTNFTTTGVNIGLTNVNNTNLKTLTQNGASNFNTFTPSYSSFLTPQTAIGTIGQSLSGVDFDGTNYVVSVAGTAAGNRLWVSSNLSTWTAISDTQIALGNSQVQYGNGIWCYLSRTSGTRQLWTSTAPATTWTQIGSVVPWTTTRQANRLRFINGQFIVLNNNSTIRFSSDGLTWTEYTANATAYGMNDIAYSPELQRYVIVCGTDVLLHFSGNTINSSSTFTAITTGVERANGITYSSKLGMFLYHGNLTPFQNYFYSRDGINWTSYTNATTVTASNNTIWINDFGGFFLDMQFNTSNLAISRDGLSFQLVANNLTLNSVNCVYNSTGKVLLIVGSSSVWGTFRNLLTDFNNYVDSDNIYNTFNSNIRFADTLEYQSQNITTATGNTHFPVSFFNRSVINFDTSSSNANIYLQGTSYNGRVGMKFKFVKTASTANNVRLHGFETCRLLTPLGNVPSFNAQSSPQTYSILPAGVFGSFDLTRVSDSGNGIWLVDNVMAMDANGTEVAISNLQSAGNLFALGRVLTLRLTDGLLEGNNATETHTTTIDTPYNLTINRNGSNGTHIKLVDFTDIGADKVGFVFYMGQQANTNLTIWQIKNSSGRDLWLHEAAYDAVANTGVRTLATSTVNNFNTYYCSFITVGGDRRWVVRRFVN